jgi:hypothetical protein
VNRRKKETEKQQLISAIARLVIAKATKKKQQRQQCFRKKANLTKPSSADVLPNTASYKKEVGHFIVSAKS